jgi:hypothetical protein
LSPPINNFLKCSGSSGSFSSSSCRKEKETSHSSQNVHIKAYFNNALVLQAPFSHHLPAEKKNTQYDDNNFQ